MFLRAWSAGPLAEVDPDCEALFHFHLAVIDVKQSVDCALLPYISIQLGTVTSQFEWVLTLQSKVLVCNVGQRFESSWLFCHLNNYV